MHRSTLSSLHGGNSTTNSLLPSSGSSTHHERSSSTLPRYKACTRELLTSICRKHFALKAVGASISGSTREAKAAARLAHHQGEDFTGLQTRTETLEQYLKRATHLQLDHLKLTHAHVQPELAALHNQNSSDHTLALAKAVRVLYLHDNALTSMEDFSFCKDALSHLYLQANQISRMENILPLQNLEKLYLSNNKIQVLEGFAEEDQRSPNDSTSSPPPVASVAPFNLVELHMDSQRLPETVGLQLSIPSIQALSGSLTILSLAGNQMTSDDILPISLLSRLVTLNLANNRIDDLKLVAEMCSYLPELRTFDLRNNTLNSGAHVTAVVQKKYRDKIIMSSRSLVLLDDKSIPDNQRDYLHSLADQKRLKRVAAAQTGASAGVEVPMSPEEAKFAALHAPPAFPYQPKVLTLRSTPTTGAIRVGQIGAFGAGLSHTMVPHHQQQPSLTASAHNYSTYRPSHQSHDSYSYGASPFIDDDPNLDGHGSSYPPSSSSSSMYPSSAASSSAGGAAAVDDSAPSSLFPPLASHEHLSDLLQTRGLVSAFGSGSISDDGASVSGSASTDPDSSRVRRATFNALNQRPNGWDGGRTQHVMPQIQSRSRTGSASTTKREQPASASRVHSRTSSQASK